MPLTALAEVAPDNPEDPPAEDAPADPVPAPAGAVLIGAVDRRRLWQLSQLEVRTLTLANRLKDAKQLTAQHKQAWKRQFEKRVKTQQRVEDDIADLQDNINRYQCKFESEVRRRKRAEDQFNQTARWLSASMAGKIGVEHEQEDPPDDSDDSD